MLQVGSVLRTSFEKATIHNVLQLFFQHQLCNYIRSRNGNKQTKFNICHHMLTLSTQLQNRSFHVVGRTRTSAKCPKIKKCTCKACKTIVLHCQICKFVTFLLLSSLWLLKLAIKQATVKCCDSPTNETSLRKQVKRKGKQQAHVQFTNTLVWQGTLIANRKKMAQVLGGFILMFLLASGKLRF